MRRTSIFMIAVMVIPLVAGCATVVPVPVPIPIAEETSTDETGGLAQEAVEEKIESEPGGATPEEAIEAYMLGIIEGNLQAVFDAAGRRDIASKFVFIRYVERLRALPVYQSLMPTDGELQVELNTTRAESQTATQVANLAWTLLAADQVDVERGIVAPVDSAWAEDVAELLDMSRLGDIEVEAIAPPDEELMATDQYQENAQATAEIYGADEYTERVATFTFEGKEYLLGFQLLRYGDRWYVLSQSSPLAGTPATGAPVKQ